MIRRRINNDVEISWSLYVGQEPADFTGKSLRLYSQLLADNARRITDFSVSGNTITFVFAADKQYSTGMYDFILEEYEDGTITHSSTLHDAVLIVSETEDESGEAYFSSNFEIVFQSLDQLNELVGEASGISSQLSGMNDISDTKYNRLLSLISQLNNLLGQLSIIDLSQGLINCGFEDAFQILYDQEGNIEAIKALYNLYSVGDIAAFGEGFDDMQEFSNVNWRLPKIIVEGEEGEEGEEVEDLDSVYGILKINGVDVANLLMWDTIFQDGKIKPDYLPAGGLNYKGAVATFDDLPSTDVYDGDMYYVTSEGELYAWNGTSWAEAGSIGTSIEANRGIQLVNGYIGHKNNAPTEADATITSLRPLSFDAYGHISGFGNEIDLGKYLPLSAGATKSLYGALHFKQTAESETTVEAISYDGTDLRIGGTSGFAIREGKIKALSDISIIQEYCRPSYVILTNGTKIEFDLNNTPISNLSTTGNSTSSITVNGQSVVINTIKEIYFGDSYKDVTSIGSSFLYYCRSLTSVDLSGLVNVTSIGTSFLAYCSSLTTLIMGAKTPPTLGNYAFLEVRTLSLIQVPYASESAYKSANGWSSKASIIQGNREKNISELLRHLQLVEIGEDAVLHLKTDLPFFSDYDVAAYGSPSGSGQPADIQYLWQLGDVGFTNADYIASNAGKFLSLALVGETYKWVLTDAPSGGSGAAYGANRGLNIINGYIGHENEVTVNADENITTLRPLLFDEYGHISGFGNEIDLYDFFPRIAGEDNPLLGDLYILQDALDETSLRNITQVLRKFHLVKVGTEDCIKVDVPLYSIGDISAFGYEGGGSGGFEIDDELSLTSGNPVMNRIITAALNTKQNTLVSGETIKTINDESILGSGNISISGGGSIVVDSSISSTSENPVQNKAIYNALLGKADKNHSHSSVDYASRLGNSYQNYSYSTLTSALAGKAPTSHNHNALHINDGVFAIARIPTGTTSDKVALGNHTHSQYADANHTHSQYANASHTHSQYLTSISQQMVINALGYTPYNDSNPSGFLNASGVKSVKVDNATNADYASRLGTTLTNYTYNDLKSALDAKANINGDITKDFSAKTLNAKGISVENNNGNQLTLQCVYNGTTHRAILSMTQNGLLLSLSGNTKCKVVGSVVATGEVTAYGS